MKKLAAVFALCAIASLAFCRASDAGNWRGCGKGCRQFRLGEITVRERSEKSGYFLKFLEGNEELFGGECAFKTHEPRTYANTPFPGCRTFLAYCFSGGAHCCTTLFIATECGLGTSLDMADLEDSGGKVKFMRVEGARGKVMRVYDWRFAYYGPVGSQVELPFIDSPAMTRLLVFDGGRWRVDRAGEFAPFYTRLFRDAVHRTRMSRRRHDAELTASLAMKAAYYSLMIGKPAAEAARVLNMLFPPMWRPETVAIFRDIRREVSEFNPVRMIR